MLDFFLILLILIGLAGAGFLVIFLTRFSEKLGQQAQVNLQQARDLQEIKEELSLGTQLQDHLKNGIEKTRDLVEDLRGAEQVRKEKEIEFLERIKRVDEVIAGTSTKGLSGEKILRQTFKKLPPGMIESNFHVGGKIVEFALILPNGKRLPIDSKWPAGDLVLELKKETSPKKREEIVKEIEKETAKRIEEVRQYIDPAVTWSQAIAAVPDSVYGVCSGAHLKARESDVILMPYSMVLPLILYMYRLHLQYAVSLDMENLQSHLISISRNLDEMEDVLENKIARGTTMVSNAYQEYRQMISRIRSSLKEFQIREVEESKKLEEPKE